MSDLYFECNSGISGDMSVAALLDLGADEAKLRRALDSLNLHNEFEYEIKRIAVNSVMAADFDVKLLNNGHHEHHAGVEQSGNHCHHDGAEPAGNHEHSHPHRNLYDVCELIDNSDAESGAKQLAKRIFTIVAEAEAKVHGKSIQEVHFHEVGAIDSIADILGFAVLLNDLNPENVYFSALSEGHGTVECCHGVLNVPVPAVCEIVSAYKIPIKIIDNEGEMVTPTGAAICASLYGGDKPENEFIIEKIGYGAGKRKYKNPVLRAMLIKKTN